MNPLRLAIAGYRLIISRFSKPIRHIPCGLQANMPPRAAWILRRWFLLFQKRSRHRNAAASITYYSRLLLLIRF
jgi:hypothetical protein